MEKYREIRWNKELEAYRKIRQKEVYIPKQEIVEAKISREEPVRFYRDWLMIKIGLGVIFMFIVIGVINIAISWNMLNTTSSAIESIETIAKQATEQAKPYQYQNSTPPKVTQRPIPTYNKPKTTVQEKIYKPITKAYNKTVIDPQKIVDNQTPWNKIIWNGKTCWFRREHGQMIKKCD